jgi:amino acid transporter
MTYEDKNKPPVFHPPVQVTPKSSWRSLMIGRPLPTADSPNETIGKLVGLAVFASDALSSTAYATQEILVILAAAGTAALGNAFPISIAIVALMVIVILSYEQTIHAYPNGGGAYVVARENLGKIPAQIAGAALLTDYILTVSVSVSSGVAQVISAFPQLFNYRVEIAIVIVMLVMVVNLRGVRESGLAFAIPAYIFLAVMLLTVGIGLFRSFSGTLGIVVNPPDLYTSYNTLQILTPFLLLHAFASGTSAMTGIEAIANGITAFKEPRSKNAGIVLFWMGGILATLFLGISYLAGVIQAIPSEGETVISQLGRTIFNGDGVVYFLLIAMTAIILFMAANTAFAGFPRLGAILAKDGFLPRQLTYRGSRLVFSRGIMALALISIVLIILFDASVNALIPLYAIGVFVSFTFSQFGMAYRWWKCGHLAPGMEIKEKSSVLHPDRFWLIKMIANGVGAICTGVVTIIFGITKFPDGAWIIVLLIPLLVVWFSAIHRHYDKIASQLSLKSYHSFPGIQRQRVLVLISGVHAGSIEGLHYAQSISDDVTAIYVCLDPEETESIQAKWNMWGEGVRLVILDSPYRMLTEPIMDYIKSLCKMRKPGEVITVVVPQFIPRKWWHNYLHSQTAFLLRMGLMLQPGVVVVEVPYLVDG